MVSRAVPFCMLRRLCRFLHLFFFNDTATTEIYTLSLHDALPISEPIDIGATARGWFWLLGFSTATPGSVAFAGVRSEEHTSELQSPCNFVCRLLLEKKKKTAAAIRTETSSCHLRALCCAHSA